MKIRKGAMSSVVTAAIYLFIGRMSLRADQTAPVNGETLKGIKVSLAAGIMAAENKGKPISAKFEVEDGKTQLSVYAAKDGKLSEIVVDHGTGKISKIEAITTGEDLTDAKAQNEAMDKAKLSLRAAVRKAVQANKGFKAIRAMPTVKEGHPVAEISIGKGKEVKTVSEKLD